MFALSKQKACPGLVWLDSAPEPDLGGDEVLIAVRYAGICGTDKHIYDWDEWAQGRIHPPLIPGHEFVGRVVDTGAGVKGIAKGVRVTAEGHIGCGQCHLCLTAKEHICPNVKVIGVDRPGAFAQYISVPQDNVWVLNDRISDRIAAIMDPLGNAVHSVTSSDVSGRSVLITGVGVIGLMAVAVAKAAGASQVIAVDIAESHLERAGQYGADHVINVADKDWAEKARCNALDGEGVEVWLEMSGAASTISSGFRALKNGGTVALLGLPREAVALNLSSDIIFKGATVKGINGRRIYETWYQMERFLTDHSLEVESLISHVFPVNQYADAFEALSSGDAIKVLLEFPEVDI